MNPTLDQAFPITFVSRLLGLRELDGDHFLPHSFGCGRMLKRNPIGENLPYGRSTKPVFLANLQGAFSESKPFSCNHTIMTGVFLWVREMISGGEPPFRHRSPFSYWRALFHAFRITVPHSVFLNSPLLSLPLIVMRSGAQKVLSTLLSTRSLLRERRLQ